MRDGMAALFTRPPEEIVDGIWDYHAARDGDHFGDEDERDWLEGGRLARNWNREFGQGEPAWPSVEDMAPVFERHPRRWLDICCGPGMGFVPRVLARYPEVSYLAMDASPRLIHALRRVHDRPLRCYDVSLASFSAFDMPLRDGSFDAVTSYLGIGSTRSGADGMRRALREVRRVLGDDGWFVTVENSFDHQAARRVFELWGQPPWQFEDVTFEALFAEAGFVQAAEPQRKTRYLCKDDNELGEQAERFGVKIAAHSTLYLLRRT